MKDWTGNHKTTFSTIGASNHSKTKREEKDFYATDPDTLVPELLKFFPKENTILEPCAGNGHLSERLKELGYKVISSDIVQRDYPLDYKDDFFNNKYLDVNIITNPPYKYANKFIEHSNKINTNGRIIAFFLPIRYLEGISRKKLFEEYPPKYVMVFSKRQKSEQNKKLNEPFTSSSAVAYCWMVWEVGYKGETILSWI